MIQDLGFKIRSWVLKNKLEFLLLVIILVVGAFLRLYRIADYMTFLGDEGRDVIVVRNLLVHADPILIGPGSSVGNIYLGPLYYYMMAPALLLAGFSPIGPAVMVALFGIATIFFLWYVIRAWFPNYKAGALALALLYAISPTVIIFSRSSWNPNIMPFFSLLAIWSLWKIHYDRGYKWLTVLGVSFALVLNSHYLGILLAPVILIYWLVSLIALRGKEEEKGRFLNYSLIACVVFLFLMSPLLIFDLRHNFQNSRALLLFITNRDGSFKGIGDALSGIQMVYTNMFTRLPAGRSAAIGLWAAVISAIFFVNILLLGRGSVKIRRPLGILALWILIGVVGLAFIEKEIYDHYIGFLFTAPFLLIAVLFRGTEGLMPKREETKYIVPVFELLGFGVLIAACISNSPLKDNPSMQLTRSQMVADKILAETESNTFDLAVLATSNYEDGYRYFLEVGGATVLHADPWHAETISENLFVVCEKEESECHPTTDPKAEVANFGPSKVVGQWEVRGTHVYKLAHNKI